MTVTVRAFVAEQVADQVVREVRDVPESELGEGDVLIDVHWSGVNYKDALACVAGGKVARLPVLIPGIDLAGRVIDAGDGGLLAGSEVLVHGYGLGVSHHGGFAERARVPAEWVVPLPPGLDARQAMTLGTAGFTAARSIDQLERRGLRPGDGEVLVTGASGGVGSSAIAMLARRGYEVVASTGKLDHSDRLLSLGAADVVDRATVSDASRPLGKERWAGVVDCVGGDTLAYALATTRTGGAVAASGNTGGATLSITVFPFILRGVALLGIDSVQVALDERIALWNRMGDDLRPIDFTILEHEVVGLDGVGRALDRVLSGGAIGRTLVRPGGNVASV
jgi:putative YhdH/YhfP family quinone oxidoreductase